VELAIYLYRVIITLLTYSRSIIMAQQQDTSSVIKVQYDEEHDILTFNFTATPQKAIAEEMADETWVRYDPKTHRIITIDVHHFSTRLQTLFGADLIYQERTDLSPIEALLGLPVTVE